MQVCPRREKRMDVPGSRSGRSLCRWIGAGPTADIHKQSLRHLPGSQGVMEIAYAWSFTAIPENHIVVRIACVRTSSPWVFSKCRFRSAPESNGWLSTSCSHKQSLKHIQGYHIAVGIECALTHTRGGTAASSALPTSGSGSGSGQTTLSSPTALNDRSMVFQNFICSPSGFCGLCSVPSSSKMNSSGNCSCSV